MTQNVPLITTTLGSLIDSGDAELQTGPFGTLLNASEYVPTGTPVVAVQNIGENRFIESDFVYVDDSTSERLAKYRLLEGDIIFGRKGAVDRRVLIRKNEVGWIQGSDCIRLRLSQKIDAEFLSYQLGNPFIKQWITANANGATMPSLNQEILSRLPLSLPPLPIQRRIADILSAYDDLIENNQRQIKLLEEAAMRLYREWFVFMRFPGHESVRIEDGVPEGWEKKKVSSIMRFVKGKNLGDVSFEKLDGYEKLLLLDGLESDVTTYACAEKQVLAKDGDILMLMDGARSSHTFITDAGIVGSTLSLIEITENQIPVSYVKGYFDANLNLFVNNNTGSAIPHANRKFIEGSDILIPNLQLLENYDNISGVFLKRVRSLNHMNQQLRISRDALLPRLMNGGEGLKLEGGAV